VKQPNFGLATDLFAIFANLKFSLEINKTPCISSLREENRDWRLPSCGEGMENGSSSGTRITLLGRLLKDPTNQAVWSEFVEHYGGKVYGWCRKWNLQEADAQDVTQDVLVKLADKMKTFHYDPSRSFRAWLKTITRHAWKDFLDSQKRLTKGSGDSGVAQMLDSLEARDDLLKHLEEEFDREILEEAMLRVRLRVAPQTWEAFRLTTMEGLSGAEAAERIPMRATQVFVAKHRVQKMLQEEIQKLEQPSLA
jgi:RNA polymerase sigma-70 factor (ECF subfamily)